MLAIKNGFEDIALKICEKGANGSIQGSDNIPPIIIAVEQGYIELVRHFIKHGNQTLPPLSSSPHLTILLQMWILILRTQVTTHH